MPSAQKELLREARSASALNDSHICVIHEVGEADGRSFIVMELVEGRPLNLLIPPQVCSQSWSCVTACKIATALAHAHDHGIIHRDIKTANIVITPSGQVKVLDFGLARRLMGEREFAEATRSIQSAIDARDVVGTLAIHCARNSMRRTSKPAQRYLVARITFFEMSAGHRPFRGQTGFELTSEILREPLPPLPPQLPPGLRRVIECCLEKEPATATSVPAKSAQPSKPFTRSRARHLSAVRAFPSRPAAFRESSLWIPGDDPRGGGPRRRPVRRQCRLVCGTEYLIVLRSRVFTLSLCSLWRISPAILNSNTSPMA